MSNKFCKQVRPYGAYYKKSKTENAVYENLKGDFA